MARQTDMDQTQQVNALPSEHAPPVEGASALTSAAAVAEPGYGRDTGLGWNGDGSLDQQQGVLGEASAGQVGADALIPQAGLQADKPDRERGFRGQDSTTPDAIDGIHQTIDTSP